MALTLPNSRDNESEADRYGIELAARPTRRWRHAMHPSPE
ncbi:MAG TPA: M48 family metalloprotease [Thiobacillus sp.]